MHTVHAITLCCFLSILIRILTLISSRSFKWIQHQFLTDSCPDVVPLHWNVLGKESELESGNVKTLSY